MGRLNDDHMVSDVDVYAMGNKHAVPAIIKEAKYGDVIIHNHPDGILDPSDADLEIASYLGSEWCWMLHCRQQCGVLIPRSKGAEKADV